MLSYNAINAQLADRTQRDHEEAARRPRAPSRAAGPVRTIRHGFWRDRVVVSVTIRPAARPS